MYVMIVNPCFSPLFSSSYIVKEGKLTPVEYKGSDYWVIFFNDRVLLTKKKGRNFKHVDTMILHNVQVRFVSFCLFANWFLFKF